MDDDFTPLATVVVPARRMMRDRLDTKYNITNEEWGMHFSIGNAGVFFRSNPKIRTNADGLAAHEWRAIINNNGTTNDGVFGRAARARLFAPASVEGPLLRLQRMSSGQFAFARRLRERCDDVFGVGKSALFFFFFLWVVEQ